MRSVTKEPDVRASATTRPVMPPQIKPIADSATVHCTPFRRNRNSPVPTVFSLLDRVVEADLADDAKQAHHQPGHHEIEQRDGAVDLAAAQRGGIDPLRDRAQLM